MDRQTFLYLNFALIVIFIFYFFFLRPKQKKPTQLNLRANEEFRKAPERSSQAKVAQIVDDEKLEPTKTVTVKPEKNLSVYFVFNGHEWEAHEILGLPAGSKMPEITAAYQNLIKTSDPSTFDFYESAYKALSKKWEYWR